MEPDAMIAIATDHDPQQVIEAIVAALRAREEKTKKAPPGHPARYCLLHFMAGDWNPEMARKTLVEDIKKLFQELSASHGPVALMMLLAPDPVSESDWNLIVSARGFDELSRGEAIRQLADLVAERFQQESWRKILRFTVLKTTDPFVEAMNERFNAEQSVLDLNNVYVDGVEIPKAIVLQSKAA